MTFERYQEYELPTVFNDEQKKRAKQQNNLDLMISLNSAKLAKGKRNKNVGGILFARCSRPSEYQNNKGNSKTFPVNFKCSCTNEAASNRFSSLVHVHS